MARGGEGCYKPGFRSLYCQHLPLTTKYASLGDTSAGCVVTESDPELEVEYRESREQDLGTAGLDSASLSDADTVNPDEDSFSILGGDSPTGPEVLMHDLPPLFLHLTCSVRLRGQHSSVPVCSLPTCLSEFGCPGEGHSSHYSLPSCLGFGESLQVYLLSTANLESMLVLGPPETPNFSSLLGHVLSSLEGPPIGGRVPLKDLSVTLDVFVLTLPLEVELPPTSDPQHHRCGGVWWRGLGPCWGRGTVKTSRGT